MLGFPKDVGCDQKCYVTHGLYGHIDPKQPPTKRKPFAAILSHDFLHKAELILPEELFYAMKTELFNAVAQPTYRKVILPLQALVEGELFNEYIKQGVLIQSMLK
jgi:ribonuclease P/MRP protein subunit RPP40